MSTKHLLIMLVMALGVTQLSMRAMDDEEVSADRQQRRQRCDRCKALTCLFAGSAVVGATTLAGMIAGSLGLGSLGRKIAQSKEEVAMSYWGGAAVGSWCGFEVGSMLAMPCFGRMAYYDARSQNKNE